jgi:hypothetical protein
MGAILRSLRALIVRTDKYARHRACTMDELRWSHCLADKLEDAYSIGLFNETARASLAAADRRAAISAKTRAEPDTATSKTVSY